MKNLITVFILVTMLFVTSCESRSGKRSRESQNRPSIVDNLASALVPGKNPVKIDIIEKGFSENDSTQYFTYTISIQNVSDKEIRAIRGALIVNDIFNSTLDDIVITVEDTIQSGTIYLFTWKKKYDQFEEDAEVLKTAEFSSLRFMWEPIKVIYSDGTSTEYMRQFLVL